MFNVGMCEAIDHGCNWDAGDVLYLDLETVVNREASSAVAIYVFRPQKSQFIIGLIERPPPTDISQMNVYMSWEVYTCLRIADGLFISQVIQLSNYYAAVSNVPSSTCITLTYSR